jgi:hypothetical protein
VQNDSTFSGIFLPKEAILFFPMYSSGALRYDLWAFISLRVGATQFEHRKGRLGGNISDP